MLKNENNSVADIATAPKRMEIELFRGLPVFDLESHDEWNSFNSGCKVKFAHWNKLLNSETVKEWARNNQYKSFYLRHHNSLIKINREKQT